MREKYGISGSVFGDCFCGTFCMPCTVCQLLSEQRHRSEEHLGEFAPINSQAAVLDSRVFDVSKASAVVPLAVATEPGEGGAMQR
jgi:hypothetical protein